MERTRLPTLQTLAARDNSLDDLGILIQRLVLTRKEGRYLEWKQFPPLGPSVGNGPKYRMVKAAISFANWEGGFIIFGVAPNGEWRGLDEAALAVVDPASLSELVNGCIFPEIPHLNYIDFRHDGKLFALLHVPPSVAAPHVTTKDVVEKDSKGTLRNVLARHALYCRQGAKSDLATPSQHHQLLSRRTERLRDELLRRVKEVAVPFPVISSTGHSSSTGATITVARLTKDPNAPAVRLTRQQDGAAGIMLHEELSDGLFDEINNVIEANTLLSGGKDAFFLGESIYYRIYAERQHVQSVASRLALLARTGLHDFYAPNLFWLLRLPPAESAAAIRHAAEDIKSPQIHGLIRLVTLLGRKASDWLWEKMELSWHRYAQKPDYYWTFQEMRAATANDSRLAALRVGKRALIEVPEGNPIAIDSLLSSPLESASLLSHACVAVFSGRKEFRQSARYLDVLTYGAELKSAAPAIMEVLVS